MSWRDNRRSKVNDDGDSEGSDSDEERVVQLRVPTGTTGTTEEEGPGGCIPLTAPVWEKILKHYSVVYRGPNAEAMLRRELDGYMVLTRSGRVNAGRFVRYMRKGFMDNELKRGGYVVKCNSKTLYLEDGRRQWRVSRNDNFIFVGEMKKSENRLLAEALLQADNERRASIRVNLME